MIALWIVIISLLIIIAITLYFFSIAFVRREDGVDNDFEGIQAKFLLEYKEEIKKGIEYINTLKCEPATILSYDGLRLYGEYYPTENARGTIILFHGYRSRAKRDFSCGVKMYKNLGLNVLLVNQRSHQKSEGKLITFGVKERFDVKNWINFIIEKNGNDEKILLGGMSMGATTVLLSSNLNLPKNVRGIIADSGFTSPVDIIKKVARQTFNINAAFVLPVLDFYCRIFGKFSIYNANTKDAVSKTDIPIIFFHGLGDNFVPSEMCRENFEACASQKELHLIEKADHGLAFFLDNQGVTAAVSAFIDRNL